MPQFAQLQVHVTSYACTSLVLPHHSLTIATAFKVMCTLAFPLARTFSKLHCSISILMPSLHSLASSPQVANHGGNSTCSDLIMRSVENKHHPTKSNQLGYYTFLLLDSPGTILS